MIGRDATPRNYGQAGHILEVCLQTGADGESRTCYDSYCFRGAASGDGDRGEELYVSMATMGVPVSQMWTVAQYVLGQRLRGSKALSTRAHAGAAVSLQPRVRWLREDSVPRRHPQAESHPRAVLCSCRRMRGTDRLDPRRRAAAASADGRDREGPGRAEEVHLSVHECDSAGEASAEV